MTYTVGGRCLSNRDIIGNAIPLQSIPSTLIQVFSTNGIEKRTGGVRI